MGRTETPGLEWRTSKAGERRAYWRARADLIKRGYRPKLVRLHYRLDNPLQLEELASRCHQLQAQMLAWSRRQHGDRGESFYDGKLETLVRIYQAHEDSPYRELEPDTQRSYTKILRLVLARVPDTYVDELNGNDVKRWFRRMCDGGAAVGYAALQINILKAVVSFGVSLGLEDCKRLRVEMREAKFKGGEERTERLTYDQVVAFRAEAHRRGRPSAALWVTLQHELSLRRRDVIGKWVDDALGTDGIRHGKRVWRDGLTWAAIDAAGVLRWTPSKTRKKKRKEVAHRIADYPDLVAELELIPAERRVGPIVISEETGLPYTSEQCRVLFRRIARAAGIPDAIWNMDARADAVTEAYEAGATTEGAMAMAAHTQASTSRRYLRDTLEQTSRVAKLRIESRKR